MRFGLASWDLGKKSFNNKTLEGAVAVTCYPEKCLDEEHCKMDVKYFMNRWTDVQNAGGTQQPCGNVLQQCVAT